MSFAPPEGGNHLSGHYLAGLESLAINLNLQQLENTESQAQAIQDTDALDSLLQSADSDSDMFSDGWLDNESQAQVIQDTDALDNLFQSTDSDSDMVTNGLLSSSGCGNCKSDDRMLPFFPRCHDSGNESESGNCQVFGELPSNMTSLKETPNVPCSGGCEDQAHHPFNSIGAMDYSSQSFKVGPSSTGVACRAPLQQCNSGSRAMRTRRAIIVAPGSPHAGLDTALLQIFSDDDFRVPPPEWAKKLKLAGLSVELTKRAKAIRRKILSRKYAGDNRKKTSQQTRAIAESHSVLQRENAELRKQNSQLRDEVAKLRRDAIALGR